MIDANKLQYFTMAAWLRGYSDCLDEYEDKYLKSRLLKAAEMLDHVWGRYVENEEERHEPPSV